MFGFVQERIAATWALRFFNPATVALVCSLLLNVGLAYKVRDLREVIATIKSEGRLKVGDKVGPLRGTDKAGRESSLTYNTESTLVYFVSPTCGWCKRNQKPFAELSERLPPDVRVAIANLSTGPTDPFLAGVSRDVVLLGGVRAESDFKVTGTPQTVLVDQRGAVAGVWNGAYSRDTVSEILRTVGGIRQRKPLSPSTD